MLRKSEQYWLCCCMSRITSGHNATLTNNSFGSKCPLQPSNVTFRYYGTPTAYIAEMEIKERSHCQRSMSVKWLSNKSYFLLSEEPPVMSKCHAGKFRFGRATSDLTMCTKVCNKFSNIPTGPKNSFVLPVSSTVKCFHFIIWYGCFLNCYQLFYSAVLLIFGRSR